MSEILEIRVPDIGDFDKVDVIEVLVSVGDTVAVDDSLLTLESDKASMEIPSTVAGKVESIAVAVGDQVGEGDVVVTVAAEAAERTADGGGAEADQLTETAEQASQPASSSEETGPEATMVVDDQPARPTPTAPPAQPSAAAEPADQDPSSAGAKALPHASPSVRRFARELGVDLSRVKGSASKGRIVREDVEGFVKSVMSGAAQAGVDAGSGGGSAEGSGIPAVPTIDFTKFGAISEQPLSRIQRASARNLWRSWVNVPHVTQFDEADVTEMEAFRKSLKAEAEQRGTKLTPLAFLMKAAVKALQEYPTFNSSLAPSGESLLIKEYYHLGIAVDTPKGLVVPVIRDVDQKSLYDLAGELGEVSERARKGKLTPNDVQGASFTISSLGGIGGTNFTPIVNAPEVAILGVARSKWQPVYDGTGFEPRLILPFSVSYDHRVIDGAAGVRFTGFLAKVLSDVRRLIL